MKVGILRETKTPPDRRTIASPQQCLEILSKFQQIDLYVQSSEIRCYKDDEYKVLGIKVTDDVSHCDILLGVKEVHIPTIIPGKTYLFFSHTAKKQPYNRGLLQAMVNHKCRLLDHEYLTDRNGLRLVAYGKWAGIVGAYNGLIAGGKKYGLYELKRAKDCFDFSEMIRQVEKVKLPPIKILITGKGRVGRGAMETLAPLNLKQISPENFLSKTYNEPVVCQIDADTYTCRKDGQPFDFGHFFKNPTLYEGLFKPYQKVTDFYVACHFWDPASPEFITAEDMREPDFKMRVISDVSCDIKKPIASTIRPSTIADPFYGVDPKTGEEGDPWKKSNITVGAVDNLPGELPRDASVFFGQGLIDRVYPSLFGEDTEGIIERACIARDGMLTQRYVYLQDFLEGK
ncbi:MAG: NAD(P)-dependent oxidoreductase [Bacteroidetes bacterium]|nr:NAD(P)-dependent oxidoreductase [Bacteroidota bacterium]